MHAAIEAEEEARERSYQGVPSDEPLNPVHDHAPEPSSPVAGSPVAESLAESESSSMSGELAPDHTPVAHPHDDQKAFGFEEPKIKLPQRETPPEMQPPEIKYGKAAEEGRHKDEWGQGSDGYKRPRSAADKMRKNLPYKVSDSSFMFSMKVRSGLLIISLVLVPALKNLLSTTLDQWVHSTNSGAIGVIFKEDDLIHCMFIWCLLHFC